MRKLIVQEFVTIDMFAAGADGELGFMPSPSEAPDDSLEEFQLAMLNDIDLILLGRNTYELFTGYWPGATSDKEIIANKLNATPKIVFSRSLNETKWGEWPAPEIDRSDVIESVKKLKQKDGKDIIIWGSISLVQSLLPSGLIDVFSLMVCPAIIGKGRRLFPEDFDTKSLSIMQTRIFESQTIMINYGTSAEALKRNP